MHTHSGLYLQIYLKFFQENKTKFGEMLSKPM